MIENNKNYVERITQIDNLLLFSFSKHIDENFKTLANHNILHSHNNPELFACKEGKVKIATEDFIYELNAGDVAIIPAKLEHTKLLEKDNSSKWISAGILCKKCKSESNRDLFSKVIQMISGTSVILFHNKPQFFELMENLLENNTSAHIEFTSQFCQLAQEISNDIPEKNQYMQKPPKDIDRLLKIDNYINAYFMQPISAKSIADDLFLSERQLSRIISKYYDVPLHTLIVKKRLDSAVNLLLNTNYSIERIALEIGFNSKVSFYKEFKKNYNTTPLQYRKKNKQ